MSQGQNSKGLFVAVLLVGLLIGAGITFVFLSNKVKPTLDASNEQKPLYWVAPMDSNYRRDKPGKSPMGMDLVPVYDEQPSNDAGGPGAVIISPEVINNLGVRTALAKRTRLKSEIVTVGYVQYDEDKLVHIHPRVSGWVDTLFVKAAGDPVVKGEPLYSLYSPELVNAQEEFVLAINRGTQRLVQGSENRLRALKIPQSFINQLKKDLKIKQHITFYAPQDGVVDNLNIREGFYVQPGTTMLSIGALDEVWVEAQVFERQASLVQVDDQVTMTLDYLPGKTWQGRVEYVYPVLDEKTRTIRIRLSFPNPNGELKPNMFTQVVIHSESQDDVLVIPREALIRTGNQDRVVLALGEGRFKSIAVSVGRADQNTVEILNGLSDGELVVTSAQFLLDSESSKTSDFKRMYHEASENNSVRVNNQELGTSASVARVTGTINSIDKDQRIINISRGPIEKWGRPAATMDFIATDLINIEQLYSGKTIDFTFDVAAGEFTILEVHKPDMDVQERDKNGSVEMDHSSHKVQSGAEL